jgi:tape measure domain-containing protein
MAEREFYRVDLVLEQHDRISSAIEGPRRRVKQMEEQVERTRRAARQPVTFKADLVDRVTSGASRIGGFLRNLTGKTWKVTVGVVDKVTGALGRIWRGITSPLGMLGMGVGAAALGAGLVALPLRMSGAMEQAQIGFTTMLGSAEKATKFMKQLKDFASLTPFEFPQLRDAAQQLLAFRFRLSDILPMMTSIGNAAAGMGRGPETIDRVVRAFGQMKAKSKVSAEEMMQLSEAGINGWVYLAEAMGKSTAQVMKLAESGLIPADKAIQHILAGMNREFPGMMAVQSRSLLGLWSTIKDTFNMNILTRWGDGLSKAVKPRMEKLVDLFTKNEDVVNRWGGTLERVAYRAGEKVMSYLERAFKVIDSLMSDPKYQSLTLFQKTAIAWDELIAKPFKAWWAGGGGEFMKKAGADIAEFMMEGFLTGLQAMAAKHPVITTVLAAAGGGKAGALFGPQGALIGAAVAGVGGYGVSSWSKYSSDQRRSVGLLAPAHTPGVYAPAGSLLGSYQRLSGYGFRPASETGAGRSSGFRLDGLGLSGVKAPLAAAGAGGPVINLIMDGAIQARVETTSGQAVDEVADLAAGVLATKLRKIFENTTR